MAKRSNTKPTTTTKATVLVCVEKNSKGEAREINALEEHVVSPAELMTAQSVHGALCLNLLAGKVHGDIIEAHAKHGGIARLFPTLANADRNALKTLLDSTPAKLQAAWAGHVERTKRIRGISLQAIAKALKGKPEGKAERATLRGDLEAWLATPAGVKFCEGKAIPQALFDIFASHSVLPADEAND